MHLLATGSGKFRPVSVSKSSNQPCIAYTILHPLFMDVSFYLPHKSREGSEEASLPPGFIALQLQRRLTWAVGSSNCCAAKLDASPAARAGRRKDPAPRGLGEGLKMLGSWRTAMRTVDWKVGDFMDETGLCHSPQYCYLPKVVLGRTLLPCKAVVPNPSRSVLWS